MTEAEPSPSAEGNMRGAAMQGADTPSWSKTPSRTKGTDRNLGDLASDRAALGLSGPRREGEEPKPMMHGHEKSSGPEIVAIRTNAGGMRREKPANKAVPTAAELVERRAGTKGNASRQSTLRAQDRAGVSQALDRIRQAARHNKKERFTALLHHINPETLRLAFNALKKDAAPGVDGTTWSDYEVDLEGKLEALHDRLHRGAYRPQPSRRVYIPKADGRQRPFAVAAVEDKIVQGAVAMVLSAIYEADFLGFSYGFRPGRGQHDAPGALAVGISSRKVNWILDADIRSFLDAAS
jgi:RNA-directed DNA polymerase